MATLTVMTRTDSGDHRIIHFNAPKSRIDEARRRISLAQQAGYIEDLPREVMSMSEKQFEAMDREKRRAV